MPASLKGKTYVQIDAIKIVFLDILVIPNKDLTSTVYHKKTNTAL